MLSPERAGHAGQVVDPVEADAAALGGSVGVRQLPGLRRT